MTLMRMKANVMHYCLSDIIMILLSISLIVCTRPYYNKIPNKSVFEPLTAKQIRKCYKIYDFDEFYSEYCPKILKCGHQENVMFIDITWRSLYKYYEFDKGEACGDVYEEYYDYQDKCSDSWWELYGHYDKKVDSILNSWNRQVSDYFSKYIDVSLVKFEENVTERYPPPGIIIQGLKERNVNLTVELIPKSEPIKQCTFKFDNHYFRTQSEVFSSAIMLDFSYVSNRYYDYDGARKVCITKVSLSNGGEYSISDLQIPKTVENYILSVNNHRFPGKNSDWIEVFEEMLGFSYEDSYKYINYSKFMAEKENDWKRLRYAREIDFVEALNKLE